MHDKVTATVNYVCTHLQPHAEFMQWTVWNGACMDDGSTPRGGKSCGVSGVPWPATLGFVPVSQHWRADANRILRFVGLRDACGRVSVLNSAWRDVVRGAVPTLSMDWMSQRRLAAPSQRLCRAPSVRTTVQAAARDGAGCTTTTPPPQIVGPRPAATVKQSARSNVAAGDRRAVEWDVGSTAVSGFAQLERRVRLQQRQQLGAEAAAIRAEATQDAVCHVPAQTRPRRRGSRRRAATRRRVVAIQDGD